MFSLTFLAALAGAAAPCTPPSDTLGADDGNPHCWTRQRRCDGPNAHPDSGPGYTPACGLCEGIGGIVWGDDAGDITIPPCTPIAAAKDVSPAPKRPVWGDGNGGKFTITNDRFIMIGKKRDPFCFEFFPSNNSVGSQCYRRQTGVLSYDMTEPVKTIRYDLQIHIPWPSDKHSFFGNVSTKIVHHGPNMWIVNLIAGFVHQCVCTQPLSTAGPGAKSHNPTPIYPVMFNWTNHMTYVGREKMEVEYGIGELELEHWIYGPHHAWTKVGDDKIIRMYQPYNGFEVFEPGSFISGQVNESVFEDMTPPALCKKGGASARIGCTDDGYPQNKTESTYVPEPATHADMKRAKTKVPKSTHKGSSFEDMSLKLNSYLKAYKNVKECAEYTTPELHTFQAIMLMLRTPEMDHVYQNTTDRRRLRGDVEEHGKRWERLHAAAKTHGKHYENMQRDGHCHEAVMWFVHHLAEPMRQEIASKIPIPMLPYGKHVCPHSLPDNEQLSLCDEYLHQVSCQDCHMDATASTATQMLV